MNDLSTITALNATSDRDFAADGRRDIELVFRRAMRHSRRVRLLRLAIPVALVLAFGTVWFVTWLDPLRVLVRLPTDSGKLVVSGTKLTMQAPKLSGYTRDGRWYELLADAAAQDITKPGIIELHGLRSKLEAEDKSVLHLTANDGLFDRKSGMLTLSRNIQLESTSGFTVHLSEAVVDTGSGDIVSNKPVEVQMLQGTLTAKRLDVTNAGEVVLFGGGVVLDLAAGALDLEPQSEARR
jgi:lipopolysaccharide export system protein LptC